MYITVHLQYDLTILCVINIAEEDGRDHFSHFQIRRRSKLPVPRVESDVSVWSLLCKNIGKDLSKICMPVSLNEPLNALQVGLKYIAVFSVHLVVFIISLELFVCTL